MLSSASDILPLAHRRFFALTRITVVTIASLGCVAAVLRSETLEEPIAIVADRVILRSEWEAQVAMYAMQTKQDVTSAAVKDSLGPAILEQMINDQLILIQAERDTTIKVGAKEIDQALEEHISELRGRFSTDAEFQAELVKEGLTERDLRVRYRREAQNQLLKQKLVQRKLADVAVSNGEVREFFKQYKDSLPIQPEGIKLAHILLTVDVNPHVVDSLRTLLAKIVNEIQNGLDFSAAARQYSNDATAGSGGDLGWFSRGEMLPAFEEAAFTLAVGQVSGIVRTPLGLHLILCVERDRDRVHARHILLPLAPLAADSAAVYRRADSLTQATKSGSDFCLLAQNFSKDTASQKNCGELGWYPVSDMYPEFKVALRDAKPGDIVGPVHTSFGWHVLRVLDRRPERHVDIASDWDQIKQMARQEKTNRVVAEWIAGIRQDTYVDIRPISGHLSIGPAGK